MWQQPEDSCGAERQAAQTYTQNSPPVSQSWPMAALMLVNVGAAVVRQAFGYRATRPTGFTGVGGTLILIAALHVEDWSLEGLPYPLHHPSSHQLAPRTPLCPLTPCLCPSTPVLILGDRWNRCQASRLNWTDYHRAGTHAGVTSQNTLHSTCTNIGLCAPKGIVWQFGKYAHSSLCWESHKKINPTLISVHGKQKYNQQLLAGS